jgi:hypothetical protein
MINMRQLLGQVFGPCSFDVFGGQGEMTRQTLATDAAVSVAYFRAVAKVAFHYFLWACPVLKGNEPSLAPLRSFILDGIGPWRDFVEFDAPQFLPWLQKRMVPVRTSHYFYASLTPEEATATVQFFVGPDLSTPSRVQLASNPLAIQAQMYTCHQARYFDNNADRADGHDGELITIDVMRQRIIAL